MNTSLAKHRQYQLESRWLSPRKNSIERTVWLAALGAMAIQEQTAITQTVLEQFTILVEAASDQVRRKKAMGRMTPKKYVEIEVHLKMALLDLIHIAQQGNHQIQIALQVR